MSALARYVAWPPREERPALLPFPLPQVAGPAWAAWRRHRAAYRTVIALALVCGLWALWEHHQLLAGVHHYADACRKVRQSCDPSGDQSGGAHQPAPPRVPVVVHTLFDMAPSVLRFLPLVVGALLGGPLFGQELEAGTHRLAWVQSVGRREWVAVKLAVATGVTAFGAVVLTAPVSWWWYASWRGHGRPGLDGYAWRAVTWWNDWDFFAYTGPVGVAHLLLALMIGAVTGLLVRRTLPAVAVSAGLCEAVLFGLGRLRSHLLTPYVLRHGYGQLAPSQPRDAWYLGGGYVRADGSLTTKDPCAGPGVKDIMTCLRQHHVVGQYDSDFRMSQFVPLQLIETAICLSAAAALAAFCLWYVPRVTAR
ncbi:hypothetical protein SAMN05216223_120126 [Actinacidiphila yanglinensis]|uniref:ABC-2 family transporter protein n=1 Tax=Actinacidiphila yanglinensis TaxID=310779 RepID=A0A1H6DWE2_9ACTN|nr:cell wall protein [Actinacidiphila yanglinensis]SEG89578.1 hypothetical protein SAMN05216223_120126 [Actinacidiphila yanglinensis]